MAALRNGAAITLAVLAPVVIAAVLFSQGIITGLILGLVVVKVVVISVATSLVARATHFLGKDEQLLVEGFSGLSVRDGPGTIVLNPFTFRSARLMKAETLAATGYAKVRDTVDGKERIVKGPCMLFLSAYDKVVDTGDARSLSSTEYALVEDKLSGAKRVVKGPCQFFPGPHDKVTSGAAISLSRTEYILVEDQLTGEKRTVKGPQIFFPEPYDRAEGKKSALSLQEDEYVRLKDVSTGQRWVQKGKALVFLEPTWRVEGITAKEPLGVRKAWALKAYEYIRLVDGVSGKISVYRGEKTVFPGPDEEPLDGQPLSAIDLKVHEYVKILDQATGDLRVESGQKNGSLQVFLGPNEKVLDNGKKKAVEVDVDHAVLIRDKSTGQLRLVKEKQLFVPGPNETIEEVRQLIRLADHEAMIVKGPQGDFQYYYGSEEKRGAESPRSFFLEPYHEIVKLCWSRGRRRSTRDLYIDRFDCRPQFMSFEFNCRTGDNVELVLEGTFFWEVIDLPVMVKSTGDTSGDLCNHARSQFIRHVARVTLKEFMDSSHTIAKRVWEEDTDFYGSRGVKIHSLEVTRYQCADSRTSEILEQIIQETTNRMNRLSQAESENEVSLFHTQGQIEQEKMKGDLLKIQHEYATKQAEIDGHAEAARIKAFMDCLGGSVAKQDDCISMWQTLKKTEALQVVSQGKCSLYYTPKDVDLSIGTHAS